MVDIERRLPDYYKDGKISIPENIKQRLENMQYRILGNHSAIEICHWTKKALLDEGACYKQRFYGVDAHMCAQIGPTAMWCSNNCIYCWRPMEFMKAIKIKEGQVDDPGIIINEAVEQRRLLLIGFKGNEKVCMEKMNQVLNEFPNHWAISLSGEPMLYPKLPGLVKQLKSNKDVRSIFIVTNGQEIEMLDKLVKQDALPTQLYVSISASNKEEYKKIHRPVHKDYWERINHTLSLLENIGTRTVIRLTVIKGLNDKNEHIKEFAQLFKSSRPDFIEVKAYMYLGYSMNRLKYNNMPTHEEIKMYARKLLEHLEDYHLEDEQPESRIVLLKRNDSNVHNIITFHDNLPPVEINENTSINTIRSKYRRTIPLLRSMGINTEKNTCRSLKQIALELGLDVGRIIEKINSFIEENYGKNRGA
ncbi:4-demethylwyosine synthase TYW1 [Candidatus Woesearchaeota archaeon]|nr:4-demethylwyosine synthase TYW1 [Candidatus Woesearchaeota archaeon]